MSNAGKSMGGGANSQHGAKGAGPAGSDTIDEFDLASDLKGKNSLHGENQLRNRNQRQAQAEAKGETEGLMESFEKLDDDVRAERDHGKRSASGKSQEKTNDE
jgi:hypothetical protein